MTFVHPSLLFALLLGAIPILIYYLIRFRSLRVDWGATYVLERALERLRKKVHLEQLILIALRVLAVLALVLAFARPVSRARAALAEGTGRHRIVVLDASYSMLAGESGATAWDRALAVTRALAGSWGRGERWSLYVLDRQPHWAVSDQPVDTPERTQAAFDALRPAEAAAALAPALEAVRARLDDRETEVYLVADDQASTWKDVEAVRFPDRVSLFWIRPPSAGSANLAVTRVALGAERVLLNHPCRAFVSVRNFGTEPAENAEVELLLDGAFHAREQISLLPGQEQGLALDAAFDEPGSHALTARLRKDALEFDNAASAGVEAVPALSVFVLRDPDRTEKFASSWGFLDAAARVMAATNEDGAALFQGGLLSVQAVDPAAGALAGADVAVLDSGCALTPERATALRAYVKAGGGLILATDDSVDWKLWNEQLAAAGLLPAPITAIRREALGGERFRSLTRSGFTGPALRALESADDGDIEQSRLYSWAELGEPAPGATVLARFAEGEPFAVERRSGLGSVIVLACGLNSRHNNLMVREFTYPLLVSLFARSAAGGLYPRTVACGEPIRLRLPAGEPPTAIQFTQDSAAPVVVPVQDLAGRPTAVLAEGSDRSGLGSMLVAGRDRHERVWFGIQGERSDSDLRPLDGDTRKRVVERLRIAEAGTWEELQAKLEASRRGAEWHPWVLLVALGVLLGEMALQRRFI